MQLPTSLRESLVEELDEYLEAFASEPDPEAVAAFVIELLEAWADEAGEDDLLTDLEESGALDEPLAERLESEVSSNDEFEFTGEELVSLLEKLCAIEWDEDDDDDEDEDEDDDLDDFDEL